MSPTKMDLTLSGFTDWLKLYRSLKPSTLKGHKFRGKNLLDGLGENSLTLNFCVSYLFEVKNKGVTNSYLKCVSKTINLLVQYGVWLGICADFRSKLPKFRDEPTDIQVLNVEDIDKILKCEGKYQEIIELLARTGRRINEATSLKVKHCDFSRNAILLENPKNGRPTWVPVPEDLMARICKLCITPSESYVFRNSKGGYVADQVVNRELKRRALKCGITQHIHAHLLRHSFATHLLEGDKVGMDKVSLLLTHSDIRTTMRYNHVLIDALKSAMNAHQLNKGNMCRKDVSDGVKKAFNVLQTHLPDWVSTSISESSEEITISVKIPHDHK